MADVFSITQSGKSQETCCSNVSTSSRTKISNVLIVTASLLIAVSTLCMILQATVPDNTRYYEMAFILALPVIVLQIFIICLILCSDAGSSCLAGGCLGCIHIVAWLVFVFYFFVFFRSDWTGHRIG